jgi:hypothetical protein
VSGLQRKSHFGLVAASRVIEKTKPFLWQAAEKGNLATNERE